MDFYFNVISLAIANRLKKAREKQGDQLHPSERRWRWISSLCCKLNAKNHTNLFSSTSGGQNSTKGFTGPKPSCWQGRVPSRGSRGERSPTFASF